MMEAVITSETPVDIQLRTRQYIPEDSELQILFIFVSLKQTPYLHDDKIDPPPPRKTQSLLRNTTHNLRPRWILWRMGSEWILDCGCGLDSNDSGQRPVASCCECANEPSGSCATELVLKSNHIEFTKLHSSHRHVSFITDINI
jgi:hypothetical protein